MLISLFKLIALLIDFLIGEMLREFDAQTMRMTEKVRRQINEDRSLVKEKIIAFFMPKISELLKQYFV